MSSTPSNPAASANAIDLSKLSRTQSSASTRLRHLAGKKNANKLKDEEIKAIFIARQPVLASIMEDVRNTQLGDAPQHHLIIGLRGMGKSTLLRRIEAELRTEEYVHRFIPLAFPEEHYARVRLDCLSEFWLNCLDSLANTRQHEGLEDEAKRLDVIIRDFMRSKLPETELATECKKVLDAELLNTGRRPVLLLDNFVKLMGRLPNHDWALRSWLQASDAPLLIAANVEQPSDLSDYSAAFYDSMKTHWIGRLDVEEVLQVLRTLGEQENRPKNIINQLYEFRPRLAALHSLAGGNPRTVIYLYQLIVSGLSISIEDDLKRLMDDIDSQYEVRLNNLADQAYEVFAALAIAWRPQSAAQIKELTKLTQGNVSGQLARLDDAGLVEKTSLFSSSKTGYQIAERLFNIWYLERIGSRRDAAPVESTAVFLEAFYTPDTMRNASQRLIDKDRWNEHDLVQVYAYAKAMVNYYKDEVVDQALSRAPLEIARQMAEYGDNISAQVQAVIHHAGLEQSEELKELTDFAQLEMALIQGVPENCSVKPREFADAVISSVAMFMGSSKTNTDRETIARAKDLNEDNIKNLMSIFSREAFDFQTEISEKSHVWLRNLLLQGKLTDRKNISQWSVLIAQENENDNLDVLLKIIPIELAEQRENILRRKLYINPWKISTWFDLAVLQTDELGRYLDAMESYKKCIEINPNDYAAWNNLGILQLNYFKDYVQAEICFLQSLKINPNQELVEKNYADLLYKYFHNYAKAKVYYKKIISSNKNDWYSRLNLGLVLMLEKNYEEAELVLRKTIKIDSNNLYCLTLLANLYHDYLYKISEAKKLYEKAIKIDANNCLAPYNLIFLLRDQLNDYAAGKELLGKYLITDICLDTLSLHHVLFAMYEDNWGNARKHFISALQHAKYTLPPETRDDWFRACAVMMHIGGAPAIEKLLGWIAELDATARLLPLVEALQAIALGSRDALMNSPAEVRPVASSIYDEIELRRVRLPAATAWKGK
jgi:Tfp pilus assembly protein PilF/DNA-binding transcriptional ArsR family regulator